MAPTASAKSRSRVPAISRGRMRDELIAQSELRPGIDGFLELYYLGRNGVGRIDHFTEFIESGDETDPRATVVSGTPSDALKQWISNVKAQITTQITDALAAAVGITQATVDRISSDSYDTLYDMEAARGGHDGRRFFVSMQVDIHVPGAGTKASSYYKIVRSADGESLWGDIPTQYAQLDRP